MKLTDLPCRRKDPDLWFPVGTGPSDRLQADKAKALCYSCPLVAACLETALQTGEQHGIWGGTDPDERRLMWKNQVKATGRTVVRKAEGDHRNRLPLVTALGGRA